MLNVEVAVTTHKRDPEVTVDSRLRSSAECGSAAKKCVGQRQKVLRKTKGCFVLSCFYHLGVPSPARALVQRMGTHP